MATQKNNYFTKEELVKLISETVDKAVKERITPKQIIIPKTQPTMTPPSTYPLPVAPKTKSQFWPNLFKIMVIILSMMLVSFLAINYISWSANKLYPKTSQLTPTITEQVKPITEPEHKEESDSITLDQPIVVDGLKEIQVARVYYIRAKMNSGKIQLRTGGSDSWRMNNPGMLVYGDFAKKMGAIAKFDGFAIFPSYDHGRNALKKLLFESNLGFKENKIINAVKTFAPKANGYNPEKYAEKIAKSLKVSVNAEMLSLTPEQKEEFVNLIQKEETWDEGRIIEYPNEQEWKKKGY